MMTTAIDNYKEDDDDDARSYARRVRRAMTTRDATRAFKGKRTCDDGERRRFAGRSLRDLPIARASGIIGRFPF